MLLVLLKWDLKNCNQQVEMGHYVQACAHGQTRTLPNPEALRRDIEEVVVNRRSSHVLFLLPWGGASTATSPGAI